MMMNSAPTENTMPRAQGIQNGANDNRTLIQHQQYQQRQVNLNQLHDLPLTVSPSPDPNFNPQSISTVNSTTEKGNIDEVRIQQYIEYIVNDTASYSFPEKACI